MKVGDMVVCDCLTNTWYKGIAGLLIGFDEHTKDPIVMYQGNRVLRLARSGLSVICD